MDRLNTEEAVFLLKMLVETNTSNPPGNEKLLADKISGYLSGTRAVVRSVPCGSGRASILAKIQGTGERKPLILCGHMDTVPFGKTARWHFPPDLLTEDGGRYYGRGTSDMKSGLAALLYAFKKAAAHPQMPLGDIYLAATADEESQGLGAQSLMGRLPLQNGIMLIAEPTANGIGICSKGTVWAHFMIKGKTAHGAYPEQGIDAIHAAVELHQTLTGFCQTYTDPLLGPSTCTMTEIRGGVKTNMVADCCETVMDIRTTPNLENTVLIEKIHAACREIMAQYDGLDIQINISNNREPVAVDPMQEPVEQVAAIIKTQTGNQPAYKGIRFFSDASVFAGNCTQLTCMLFGPGREENAHIVDEYVDKDAYFTSIVCYNELLHTYFS